MNKSHSLLVSVFCVSASMPIMAQAQTISASSNVTYVRVGTNFDVNVSASGFGGLSSPSLGAYDFNLIYGSAFASLNNVNFTPNLSSDPMFSISAFDSSNAGTVNVFEVSLQSAAALNAAQPASFSLATLTFTANNVGSFNVGINGLAFADADGVALTPTLNGTTIFMVDRTDIAEYAQPLAGGILALSRFTDIINDCEGDASMSVSGNTGTTGCAYIGYDSISGDYNIASVEEDSSSIYGGGIAELSNGIIIGGGISFGKFDTIHRPASSITGGNRDTFGGLLGYRSGSFIATATIAQSKTDGDLRKTHANLGGITSSASLESKQTAGKLALRYVKKSGDFTFTPHISLMAIDTTLDGFSETGGDVLGITSDGYSGTSYLSELSVSASRKFDLGPKTSLIPTAEFGWLYSFDDTYQLDATFLDNVGAATPDLSQTIKAMDSSLIKAGLSLKLIHDQKYTLQLGYNGNLGTDTTEHIGALKAGIHF